MNRRSFFKTISGIVGGLVVAFRPAEEVFSSTGGGSSEPSSSISASWPDCPNGGVRKSKEGINSAELPEPCRNCSSVCMAKEFFNDSPEHPVGTRYVSPCGRTFRYAMWKRRSKYEQAGHSRL